MPHVIARDRSTGGGGGRRRRARRPGGRPGARRARAPAWSSSRRRTPRAGRSCSPRRRPGAATSPASSTGGWRRRSTRAWSSATASTPTPTTSWRSTRTSSSSPPAACPTELPARGPGPGPRQLGRAVRDRRARAAPCCVYDDNGAEPAWTPRELLARGGARVELVTPERMLAPGGRQHELPGVPQAFAETGVAVTLAHRLTSGPPRRTAAGCVATLASDYADVAARAHRRRGRRRARHAAQRRALLRPAAGSSNLGEVDQQALLDRSRRSSSCATPAAATSCSGSATRSAAATSTPRSTTRCACASPPDPRPVRTRTPMTALADTPYRHPTGRPRCSPRRVPGRPLESPFYTSREIFDLDVAASSGAAGSSSPPRPRCANRVTSSPSRSVRIR